MTTRRPIAEDTHRTAERPPRARRPRPAPPPPGPRAAELLARVHGSLAEARRALDPSVCLPRVNFELGDAGALVIQRIALVRAMLPELEARTDYAASDLEHLERCAWSALDVARRWRGRHHGAAPKVEGERAHRAAVVEGMGLRGRLAYAARDLAYWGDLERPLVDGLELGWRTKTLADDLAKLAGFFGAREEAVKPKVRFPWSDVARAGALYFTLKLERPSLKAVHTPEREAAADERRRTATLLVRAYQKLVFAAGFVRAELGDVRALFPDFCTPKKRRPKLPASAPLPCRFGGARVMLAAAVERLAREEATAEAASARAEVGTAGAPKAAVGATPEAAARAFERQAKARADLAREEVQAPVGWDLGDAASVALKLARRLRPIASSLEARTSFGAPEIAALEATALAAAHAAYAVKATRGGHRRPPGASKAELALVEAGTRLRHRLAKQADDLVYWDALGDETPELELGWTPSSLAGDLLVLTGFYEANADRLEGKTAFDWRELERANALAVDLAMNRRRPPKTSDAERRAADDAARAATLLTRAYHEAELAVAYARREVGDADELAPSLGAALHRALKKGRRVHRA